MNIQRYMEAKYGPSKDYPLRDVTKEEFVNAMVAIGIPKEKAEESAYFSKELGSYIVVGKEKLRVV